MTGRNILITGATGFLGGRLVECLAQGPPNHLRCLVRDYAHCSRLARFPVELWRGSLDDVTGLAAAADDMDIVFHCAYDYTSQEVNVAAAEALARACARSGGRLVHVSSAVVYHPPPEGLFDESWPREPSGRAYADSKLAAEEAVLAVGRELDAAVTVVQPTTIYGPHCLAWTVNVARQLRSGQLVLPADATGWCNAVYVDDVARALRLAAERPAALGQRFLISGPEPVPWLDFYRAFDDALETGALRLEEVDELTAAAGQGLGARLRQFRANPKRLLELRPVRALYDVTRRLTGQGLWDRVKDRLPPPRHLPDEGLLELYRSRAIADISKAREQLGYEPRFDFATGLALTAAWLRWSGF